MTLTLHEQAVVIACDHPSCRREIVAADAFGARGLAKLEGWREKERPMRVDSWWVCSEHRGWRPEDGK